MKDKIWELYEEIRITVIRNKNMSARKRNLLLSKLSDLVAMIFYENKEK